MVKPQECNIEAWCTLGPRKVLRKSDGLSVASGVMPNGMVRDNKSMDDQYCRSRRGVEMAKSLLKPKHADPALMGRVL